MARPRHIDPTIVRRAMKIAATATSLETLRECQSILLPAQHNATLSQTASALGVSRATVARLQARFRKGIDSFPSGERNWGGRRRANLTLKQERIFLQPWLEQAVAGAMVVVSPIRAALSQKLDRPVKASVVYRLLARHGWRKVAPDTRHPKSKLEVQEDWKKNSRWNWKPS